MSTEAGGGPAFPSDLGAIHAVPGMTLRDYFAAQAVVAIIHDCRHDTYRPGENRPTYFARRAYEVADAMLEARDAS